MKTIELTVEGMIRSMEHVFNNAQNAVARGDVKEYNFNREVWDAMKEKLDEMIRK